MNPDPQVSTRPHTDCGIPAIGEIRWGSHFCHFYRGKDELVDSLVPYFEAGLQNNERCLWITARPFLAEEAHEELQRRVPHLAGLIERGDIVIRNFDEWYTSGSKQEDVSEAWIRQETRALADGFSGLRVAGNAGFLEREHRLAFSDYERKVHKLFEGRRIVALCSYDLLQCQATDIFEVVRNHGFTIDRRDGRWEIIESSDSGPE
jgi:hypothetical protein